MRAKVPVSIDDIEFDALIEEERTLESEVPEYPVESGFAVSDAIIKKAEKLSMTLFVTDTPVSWRERHGSQQGRAAQICKQLEDLYFQSKLVTVTTTDTVYTDMAITSITFSKSVEVGYAREIPISFTKVRKTESKTTTIPASYGKSGQTAAPAGTANVTYSSGGAYAGTTGGTYAGATVNSYGGNTVAPAQQTGTERASRGERRASALYQLAESAGVI